MKERNYQNIKDEDSLFNNQRFVSLEEIAENEIPAVDNEIFSDIDKEFSNNILEGYFNHIYGSKRNLEIAKKFYGVGQENKTIHDLAKEYSLSCGRIQQIVSEPHNYGWRDMTIKILKFIKTKELNPLENLKEDSWFRYNYSFLFK